MEEKPIKNGEKLERNPDGTIKSGVLNPNGRPPNTKNFSTLFEEAIKKIAKDEGSNAEMDLVLTAIKEAKDGKFNYYKDIIDRIYGTPVQKTDITSDGEQIKEIKYIIPENKVE